ncbi:MAG: rod shape-determining protein MreC [Clostridia bacterium]|nr:rod shape-determining protein MreC [Clostridia bacterium]
MRFFFRSRQFKIIVAVFTAVVLFTAIFGWVGTRMAPQADLAGMISAPFQALAAKISDDVSDFVSAYQDGNQLLLENARLQSELNDLREQLADYQSTLSENEFLRNYLGIKENNPSLTMTPATRIAKDSEDMYSGFIINRGSLAGITANSPVITEAGLVGYITEVGLTTAKVTTVLSPELTAGALDNRTADSGILSGTSALAENGCCKFYNLSRNCNIAIGDYVITSGEGIFPGGLMVGTIEQIGSDDYNTSIFATVRPFVDFQKIRNVMVVTGFAGQGGLDPNGED